LRRARAAFRDEVEVPSISNVRRVLLALAAGLAALAAVGAAAPFAGPPLRPIAHGVTVGGVPVGGLTSERARVRLARAFAKPLALNLGTRRWSVSPRRFHARAAVDAAVARALRAGRGERVYVPVGVATPAVRDFVDRLADEVGVAPVDAKLVGIDDQARPLVQSPRDGRALDTAAVTRAVRWELRHGRRNPMRLPLKTIAPKIARDDIGPVIVIERGANRLTLYDGDRPVQAFGVATGQAIYPTPAGDWHIVTMQRDPWWIPPDSPWAKGAKPIPPGPGNPLGTRWMGLDAAGVGIHGTPDAASIGYSASHGCIRMRIPDAEWLFDHVHVGTPVFVV
jgi:lipoprotein-anchoring transpeptidase ErfK/SrfK